MNFQYIFIFILLLEINISFQFSFGDDNPSFLKEKTQTVNELIKGTKDFENEIKEMKEKNKLENINMDALKEEYLNGNSYISHIFLHSYIK